VAERSDQAGSVSLEVVILAPAMLMLVLLLVIGGRLADTRIAVQGAARNAARAASLEREAGDAEDAARDSADWALDERDVTCKPKAVDTDVTRFRPGGQVTVTVYCTVGLGDLGLLAVPPTKVVRASFTEPIDRFREVGG
jgi:Flp pilus assembly protein TadG